MKLKRIALLLGTSTGLLALAPFAHAENHAFNLSGHTATGTYIQSNEGVSGFIPLSDSNAISGLLPGITISAGDTITATISLDQGLSLPASFVNPQPYAAYFGLNLGNYDPTKVLGGTTASFTSSFRFFDHGSEVTPGSSPELRGGCGNIFCVGSTYVSATQAFSFDKIEVTAHIDAFGYQSYGDVTQVFTTPSLGQFSYFVSSPVPEVSSSSMLLAGLGLLGLMATRRKRS